MLPPLPRPERSCLFLKNNHPAADPESIRGGEFSDPLRAALIERYGTSFEVDDLSAGVALDYSKGKGEYWATDIHLVIL